MKVILNIIFIITISASLPVLSYPRSLVAVYHNKLEKKKSNITTDSSEDFTTETVPSDFSRSNRGLWQDFKGRRTDPFAKTGIKRNLDIGIHLKIPSTPKYTPQDNLEKLEDVLEKALEVRLEALNTTGCPSCEEEEEVPGVPAKRYIKPAYKCDEWDYKFRICILERNIGDAVTFYLSTGQSGGHKPNVTWRKEFHIQDSNTRKEFVIEPENCPENIIIGRKGYEFRISPITEIDLGFNMFSATLEQSSSPHHKVFFMLRVVPIDLGFVYVGETIELNLRSYVSLPAESLSFRWYMEKDGEHGTLPSNMRISSSGSSMKILELRQDQEGILACSVYTNLDFLATKKRFLMKDLYKNNDVLKSTPDHNLRFEEQPDRGKRDRKKMKRSKRDVNADDFVEKALMQPTTTEKQLARAHETTTTYNKDYDIGKDIGHEEQKPKDYEDVSYDLEDKRLQQSNLGGSGNRQSQLKKNRYESMENYPGETNPQALVDSESYSINEGNPSKLQVADNLNRAKIKSGEKLQSHISNGKVKNGKNNFSQKNKSYKNEQYVQNSKYPSRNDESGIILNIDKIPGPRRISAEENIAKLISSCYSDFECSGSAMCVRNNLKLAGYCKCLPGFYGVGIFCREDIWISKSNYGMDDLHNPDDFPYSSAPFDDDNI